MTSSYNHAHLNKAIIKRKFELLTQVDLGDPQKKADMIAFSYYRRKDDPSKMVAANSLDKQAYTQKEPLLSYMGEVETRPLFTVTMGDVLDCFGSNMNAILETALSYTNVDEIEFIKNTIKETPAATDRVRP